MDILIFLVNGQQLGFPLSCIQRVIRAVKVTKLPNAPSHILGVIDLQGDVIPVIDFRHLLSFEERKVSLTDQFILCKNANAMAAFWVDSAIQTFTYSQESVISSNILEDKHLQEKTSNIGCLDHVIKNQDGIILVYSLDKLFEFYHLDFVQFLGEESRARHLH